MVSEIWKDIQGYESHYQISSLGNVKSLKRSKEKLLTKNKDSDGYFVVALYVDNFRKTIKVHRLVATAFHTNDNSYPTVNHLDGNKVNNHYLNLEWCSVRENTSHGFKSKTYTSSTFVRVSLDKRSSTNRWTAAIGINGRQKHLGNFSTEEEASDAYQRALKENKIINKYSK